VLGSTHAEIPRVIGDAGLTFEERNTEQLLENMQRLLDSPALRAEFAEKGRRRVLEQYTNTCIADHTYDVYRELLA
jgi:glycosyltransferase involved in cell wall biosynthesis